MGLGEEASLELSRRACDARACEREGETECGEGKVEKQGDISKV